MCDFGASSIAFGITSIVSTALGVMSSVSEAKNSEIQYKNQQEANKQQLDKALENAANERQQGLEESRKEKIKTLYAVGNKKVQLASSGLDVGFGTGLDMIEDISVMGELEALMIQNNSEKRAKAYDLTAQNYANKMSLTSYNYKKSQTNSLGSSLIKTGKSTVTMWKGLTDLDIK